MKKVVFLVVALFAAITFTNAQTGFKKGNKFVEGSVSYTKAEGTDATYGFQPTIGYFLTDRFAVGVSGDFSKDENGVETTGFGAFGRCYVLNIGQNFKAFSQLGVGTTTINNAGVKATGTGVNFGFGANYFVSSKLALSVGLADVINYTSVEGNSTFNIGWSGVSNPLNAANFGVLYKF
jgi:outer membrane protein